MKILIAAAALLAALLVSCSGAAEAAEPTRADRSDPWLTLGPGQAVTLNEYLSAYPKPPPADYQSATPTTRPPRPECSQKGYRVPGWNEEEGRWRECELPSPPYCGRGETPKWVAATGRWICEKPVRPICQEKGYVSDWDGTAGEWGECEKPEANITCGGYYPDLIWAHGQWDCYESCPDGQISRLNLSGDPSCYAEAEYCGPGLVSVYVPSADRYLCSETEKTATEFWEYTKHTLTSNGINVNGKWIGGLADNYNEYLWYPDLTSTVENPEQVWVYSNRESDEGWLAEIGAGSHKIDICYNHDCDSPNSLLGSTDPASSSCRAHFWNSEGGLWFAMNINETNSACLEAYNRVASGRINGISLGAFNAYHKETAETRERHGQLMPVKHAAPRVNLHEITLTDGKETPDGAYSRPVNKHTWVSYRNFG